MRKTTLVFALLLLFWFTLDITGFGFGNVTLVVSALIDEPIDLLFWFIFAASIAHFAFQPKVGIFPLTAWLGCWGIFQLSMYVTFNPDRIASYNRFFANEGTFYLFPPSDTHLVKDFYHSMGEVLVVATFVLCVTYLVQSLKSMSSKMNQSLPAGS